MTPKLTVEPVDPGFEYLDPVTVDGRLVGEGYWPIRYMTREELAELYPNAQPQPDPEPTDEDT
jgi:hypothetical protein